MKLGLLEPIHSTATLLAQLLQLQNKLKKLFGLLLSRARRDYISPLRNCPTLS
jgi:hypothetical protein